MQFGNDAFHRLAESRVGADHSGVDQGGHGPNLAQRRAPAQGEQFGRTLAHVGMRVLLVGDDDVGLAQHGRAQVAMQVEFDADDSPRYERPNA